jgi:AraC-like DNA-binding protein
MRTETEAHESGSYGIPAPKGCLPRTERITEFVHTASQGRISVIRGTDITHEFAVHAHHTYTIGIVETGCRVIRLKGTETVVHVGSGFVIEPWEPHSCVPLQESGHTYTVISVEQNLMVYVASGMNNGPDRVPLFHNLLFRDHDLFNRISRLWNDRAEGCSSEDFPGRLLPILRTLISRYAQTVSRERPAAHAESSVRKVRRYLESNTHTNLSQKKIAEMAGLSEAYFNRTFKRLTGIPPHVYHLRIRIRKAQELLGQGVSIVTAALDTGFVDQSHFTHCFKKTVGVTPSRYKLHGLLGATSLKGNGPDTR